MKDHLDEEQLLLGLGWHTLEKIEIELRERKAHENIHKSLKFENRNLESVYRRFRNASDLRHLQSSAIFAGIPIVVWLVTYMVLTFKKPFSEQYVMPAIGVAAVFAAVAAAVWLIFKQNKVPAAIAAPTYVVGAFLFAVGKVFVVRSFSPEPHLYPLGASFLLITFFAAIIGQLSRWPLIILGTGLTLFLAYLRQDALKAAEGDPMRAFAATEMATMITAVLIAFVAAFYNSKHRRRSWLQDAVRDAKVFEANLAAADEKERRRRQRRTQGLPPDDEVD